MSEVLLADLRRAIEGAADCHQPTPERRFHKHDEYLSYGLKTADFRNVLKEFRPRFLELPLQGRLDLAAKLLGEHVGELGHAGIYIVALSVEELEPGHFPVLDSLMDDFRSWSQVDHFCGNVMQPLLWKYRDDTLVLVEEWNRSTNRWKRRASVVTFTRGVGETGEFTEEVLRLCENLVLDEEDIVQKGVGWALKDNLRSAPERVLPYIKELRRRGVSSTITLYAIRDLKGAEREAVLAVKKGKGKSGRCFGGL
ncbi:MAG: DNA alkylation repair protein [Candidatus Aminicenantes bacterium]|nr:DNA alkylation repair protein [Candidatus Aminicenantes bacterium]